MSPGFPGMSTRKVISRWGKQRGMCLWFSLSDPALPAKPPCPSVGSWERRSWHFPPWVACSPRLRRKDKAIRAAGDGAFALSPHPPFFSLLWLLPCGAGAGEAAASGSVPHRVCRRGWEGPGNGAPDTLPVIPLRRSRLPTANERLRGL